MIKHSRHIDLVANTPYLIEHNLHDDSVMVATYDNGESIMLSIVLVDSDKLTLTSAMDLKDIKVVIIGTDAFDNNYWKRERRNKIIDDLVPSDPFEKYLADD